MESSKGPRKFAIGCLVVFLLGIVLIGGACGPEVTNIEAEHCGDAAGEAVDKLKRVLKDPDSLKDVKVSVIHLGTLETPRTFITVTYRAKNSFGGYIRGEERFDLDYETCEVSW